MIKERFRDNQGLSIKARFIINLNLENNTGYIIGFCALNLSVN